MRPVRAGDGRDSREDTRGLEALRFLTVREVALMLMLAPKTIANRCARFKLRRL
jgi:hypothetical protein